LAAQIVKNYILPMFESDEKRYLKRKYDHLHSPKSQSKRQPSQQTARETAAVDSAMGVPKTVYGELKLSEQLSFQLDELKQRFDNLREQLEYTSYQRESLQRELVTLQQKHSQRGDQIKNMKKEMQQMKLTMTESIQKCFQLIANVTIFYINSLLG